MVAPTPSADGHSKVKVLLPVFRETAEHWMQDNAMRLSAALSVYTALSLAPLLVVIIKIVGLFWTGNQNAQQLIAHLLSSIMGEQVANAVKPLLSAGGQVGHGIVATCLSIAVLLFSAAGVFVELQDDMNLIWSVKPKPNQGVMGFVRNRLLSMAMVLGIAFLLLVSMFVSTALSTLVGYIGGQAKWLSIVADILVSYAVITLLFAAIYKFLPDAKVAWRHVWLGALLSAAMFEVGKYVLTAYFRFASPTSAFGAAGSLAAVLLWVYYSAFILFFGAEFTKAWALHHGHRIVPQEHAEPRPQIKPSPERIHAQSQSRQSAHGN